MAEIMSRFWPTCRFMDIIQGFFAFVHQVSTFVIDF
jgi:hypothetical protein